MPERARRSSEQPRNTPQTRRSLAEVREEAKTCRRCNLWRNATQTVFGKGPRGARLMLVGEQPGDMEDREGAPFVGPAGRLLRDALQEAGVDPASVYMTNVVKHFKWEPRGKRRIHKRPNREETSACRPWLDAEIAYVKPRAIVALGATAAYEILGAKVSVTRDRAKPIPSPLAELVTLTIHPSSILRMPDAESRALAHKQFVADFRAIAARLG